MNYSKVEIYAAVIIIGIIVGIITFVIGTVWFIADLITPTNKLIWFFSMQDIGIKVFLIGVGIFAGFFMTVLLAVFYNRGYEAIKEKLED
ncbi:MAG: hypothetical protein ACTSVY_05275 [Candidatus Helarchaeota archaeon]